MKKLMLIILDGWGISSSINCSAIEQAYTPFIDYCCDNYPFSKLEASGAYVGLPKNQMGNSEVGHMNLGSGRKVVQTLEKINRSIENGLFRKKINPIFDKIRKKRIHFIGLLSDGGVHSHMNHLFYLLKIAHEKKINDVFIHVFTDGRDSSPRMSIFYIKELLKKTKKYVGKLSTVTGRYYSMDRDQRLERTNKAYNAMVHSKGFYTKNVFSSIEEFYKNGITDEFLSPLIIIDDKGVPVAKIENGDVVFCFNFRSDRSRQITEFLNDNDSFLDYSDLRKINLSHYITMTCFNPKYKNVSVLFERDYLINTLGEILEKEGRKQIRIAETEKYPHVTFFFSGGRETPFDKETRIICSSPKVSTYDLKPEMSAKNIVKKIIPELNKKISDFICLNFANPDMVGHTGKMDKTIKACEFVDFYTKSCVEEAIKNSYIVIIVGDHGNADCMINPDGSPNTTHTTSLVPFIILDQKINKQNFLLKKKGSLSDVAPTILQLMGIPIPNIMTGSSMIIDHNKI
ncbi:2,3-bisphosphoglycerate-independent phosphoglycerate mutase [Blattabacterium cuenoti]|uniref:2,3-bisphosphoglycerate-independent phosphoglycerate mutase n=1 Tax=Blattabacterium cuenoti TaxID=1653831 RepID=UPI00163D18B3|nr:2,3-bisphosphoglycerate-independent phosphoglycerate mutase [Blattabacterium cuenoti]